MTEKQSKLNYDNLLSQAMLVKFSVSRWGVSKREDSIEEDVAKTHKAEGSMLKFKKILLKSDALDKFHQVARGAYQYHRTHTLMWDKGVGLLPSSQFWKYNERMEAFKREGDVHAEAFAKEYKANWSNGMSAFRERLGDLFNSEDYPDPSVVRSKFAIRIRVRPLENPNDFRVQLGSGQTAAIKAQMMEEIKSEIAELMKEPYHRLHKVIAKVHKKLSGSDEKFRDSLIENVKELVEILPALNVTGDKELEKLITMVKKEICVDDIDALRKDDKFRASVAKSAEEILKGMKGYVL